MFCILRAAIYQLRQATTASHTIPLMKLPPRCTTSVLLTYSWSTIWRPYLRWRPTRTRTTCGWRIPVPFQNPHFCHETNYHESDIRAKKTLRYVMLLRLDKRFSEAISKNWVASYFKLVKQWQQRTTTKIIFNLRRCPEDHKSNRWCHEGALPSNIEAAQTLSDKRRLSPDESVENHNKSQKEELWFLQAHAYLHTTSWSIDKHGGWLWIRSIVRGLLPR